MNIKNHTKEKLHDISKVIENPKNPNKHSDSQIAMLSKIIEFQGWRIPIVVSNRSGFIVRGHGRLMSARKLGLEKVPVSFQDYESEAQEWADLIADNRIAELAEMDRSELKDIIEQLDTGEIDLDLTGFDQESLEDLMSEFFEPEEGLTDDDEIPEEVEPRCKPGDLWQLGEHRLMCGDSTSEEMVAKLLNKQKAEIIFTDPPYNVSFNGRSGKHEVIKNDNLTKKDFEEFILKFLKIIKSLNYESLYIWCNWKFYGILQENLDYNACIVWAKNVFGLGVGYRHQHEFCLFSGKIDEDIKNESDLWAEKKDSNYKHPTQKPTELACRALKNHKKKINVLDLFLGSGSTLIACEKLNRKCYGMELDPHYCDVIIQRWEDFTGKKAEKIN